MNTPIDEALEYRLNHDKPIGAACHEYRKFKEPFLHWRSLESQIAEKYGVATEVALNALQALIDTGPTTFYKVMTDRVYPSPLSRWLNIVVGWTSIELTRQHANFVKREFQGNELIFEFKANPSDIILIHHDSSLTNPSVHNMIQCAGFEKNEIWDIQILNHSHPAGARRILKQSGINENQFHPYLRANDGLI